jgi:hypothetical protein
MAEVYDGWFGNPEDADEAGSFLSKLAGRGPALGLEIGTERVAPPLSEKRIEVHGIDAFEAMVEQPQAKPGGDCVHVAIGDFADVDFGGRFSLVYVVFDTFFALLTQEDQVRRVANVAGVRMREARSSWGRSFPTPNASRKVILPKLSGSRWTASSSRPRATLRSTSASTRRTS